MSTELEDNFLATHSLMYSATSQIYKKLKDGTHSGTLPQQVHTQQFLTQLQTQQLPYQNHL